VLLATVKGDVHDIGKNIVGVVLGCNDYEVIDLGVMVPIEKIVETARKEAVDVIGLSGLITPSLDEMVTDAKELQREGFTVPLLIGGATTSGPHTAVKIAPHYASPTVHVLDASRVVGVVSALLDPGRKAAFAEENQKKQAHLRALHAGKQSRPLVAIEDARKRGARIDWQAEDVAVPARTELRTLEKLPLREIAQYVDWQYFFYAWDLRGKFPEILDDPEKGAAARDLYAAGQELLEKIVRGGLLTARARYGFFPANADGDDVVVWTDPDRGQERLRFNMLRQQQVSGRDRDCLCLADFIAPASSDLVDWIGGFVVTAGIGADDLARQYQDGGDDYNAIMVKALADRLAEAAAEWLHARVRRDFGYGKDEHYTNVDLIHERYRGIRPAFGYPACPDHSEKQKLFDLVAGGDIGVALTDHFAMVPAASVSGLYFAHPKAHYFTVGKVGRDQVADYARRKGLDPKVAERWLSPILGYEPESAGGDAAA
jgi:5-methyltetrahydrofolate--homocysteine methyltransferase